MFYFKIDTFQITNLPLNTRCTGLKTWRVKKNPADKDIKFFIYTYILGHEGVPLSHLGKKKDENILYRLKKYENLHSSSSPSSSSSMADP